MTNTDPIQYDEHGDPISTDSPLVAIWRDRIYPDRFGTYAVDGTGTGSRVGTFASRSEAAAFLQENAR